MKGSYLLGAVSACVFTLFSSSSHAVLVSILGGQAVYDDDLDISWVENAQLAASNTFGLATDVSLGTHPGDISGVEGIINADGTMNWTGALFWIDAMNAANYLGFNNWRLPSADVNGDGVILDCTGGGIPGCKDNEMGFLYHDEGITASGPGPFSNIQHSVASPDYWSGTEFNTTGAYIFRFDLGLQNAFGKAFTFNAWAVHDGDISAVPAPAAVWLFGSGLLGLVGIARRKKT